MAVVWRRKTRNETRTLILMPMIRSWTMFERCWVSIWFGFGAQKNGATVLRWDALPGGGEVAADRIFTWSLRDLRQ